MSIPFIPPATAFTAVLNGKNSGLWVLQNSLISCAITNYGARLVSLIVSDKQGDRTDVMLGYSSLKEYISASDAYYGAIVGRYANRIANGTFTLDGIHYRLPINNDPNTLHGGPYGFHARVWTVVRASDTLIELRYFSADNEEGFPGNMEVVVTYELIENELHIHYNASTDKPTVINLSNHTYFNLNGEGNGSINAHTLQIAADTYTPVDETLIPTGELASVSGTPFDFRHPRTIGYLLHSADEQLKYAGGYDHNFVLAATAGKPQITITGDKSCITMSILTDQPGMQFYGGNAMSGKDVGKSGRVYGRQHAFVLEPQHFPDSPNHSSFPDTTLRPGDVFTSTSVYSFTHSGK